MYSTVGLLKNAKHSGKLVGTHQRLDRAARAWFTRMAPEHEFFPTAKEIQHFEGNRGPDGLKWKSPGIDEPMHFILPDNDDGKLVSMILNHQYNLRQALKTGNRERAAFEAAWMAHAITDGLTPAHHFPYQEAVSELMTDKEYVKIFGRPVKGIMRGDTIAEATRNNWLYWGVEGYMTKHIAFEYGVALVAAPMTNKALIPKLKLAELKKYQDYEHIDLKSEFYASLKKIDDLKMYDRFRKNGWNTELALESKKILLPEIVKLITLGWISSLPIASGELVGNSVENHKTTSGLTSEDMEKK